MTSEERTEENIWEPEGKTCCFTGHRPAKLPWGRDERAPECIALKRSMLREIEQLYLQGYRRFISGMAQGCDLYFAQAVLEFQQLYLAVCKGICLDGGRDPQRACGFRCALQFRVDGETQPQIIGD